MLARLLIAALLLTTLAAWSDRRPAWPHSGPMPDQPVDVPPSRYAPVCAGTKTYLPVDPMPWADVNKRVAPPTIAPTDASPEEAAPGGHDGH